MKRNYFVLFLFLCFSLVLSGCAKTENSDQDRDAALSEERMQALLDNVREQSEFFYNEWERMDPFVDRTADVCVPDAETALDLGNVLLIQFQKRGFFPGAIPQKIAYQEDPSIWIISCWNESAPDEPRATVSFAIRKDNAQVVKIWLDEPNTGTAGDAAPGAACLLTDKKRELLISSVRVLSESEKNYWEQIEERCLFTEPCVPDAETALLYGNALLEKYQRDKFFPNYLPQLIYYQKDPTIWILSYWEDLGPYTISACVSFAISETDAQVIAIWVGE